MRPFAFHHRPIPFLFAAFILLGLTAGTSAFEPTSHYVVKNIEGWHVYVHQDLIQGGKLQDVGKPALKQLTYGLAKTAQMVADGPLKKLRAVKIWLEVNSTRGKHGNTSGYQYHPGLGWLEKMDFNPQKLHCVEFGNAAGLAKRSDFKTVQVTMHELAHAYHHQVYTFEDTDVLAAHKRAKEDGKYPKTDWVVRTNHKEFYAGLVTRYYESEERRKEIVERDLIFAKKLEEQWGKPKALFRTPLAANAQAPAPAEVKPEVGGSPVIAAGAKLKTISLDFKFTEGPATDKAGNVYFTDQPNNRIMKYGIDGKMTTFMKPAGRSNGLCFTADGTLIACADEKNEMWAINVSDKSKKVIINNYKGKLLNAPNDVWVDPKGGIYFSDPFYKRKWWKRGPSEQDTQAVYYLPKGAKEIRRVAENFKQPNGLIGTPDGKTMYIADIRGRKTYSYDIAADGSLKNRKFFCNSGSDGMTIDDQGNVYLTGNGVLVFDKTGKKIEHIKLKGWTANVCFGGADMQTLFITATKGFYGMKMKVKGVGSQ
jgi:gluconolactonase